MLFKVSVRKSLRLGSLPAPYARSKRDLSPISPSEHPSRSLRPTRAGTGPARIALRHPRYLALLHGAEVFGTRSRKNASNLRLSGGLIAKRAPNRDFVRLAVKKSTNNHPITENSMQKVLEWCHESLCQPSISSGVLAIASRADAQLRRATMSGDASWQSSDY